MNHSNNIDRQWKLYSQGELFATLSENGDDCPTLTFSPDQVGGDGKPLTVADDALRVLHAALGEMLQINQDRGGC